MVLIYEFKSDIILQLTKVAAGGFSKMKNSNEQIVVFHRLVLYNLNLTEFQQFPEGTIVGRSGGRSLPYPY